MSSPALPLISSQYRIALFQHAAAILFKDFPEDRPS